MKAIVCGKYGPPEALRLESVESPVPADNEVLIKIHATTVTSGDCRVRSLRVPSGFGLIMRLVFGIAGPRQPVLGSELAGVIESVGSAVKGFKVGDPVFAFSDVGMGCHAEYKCMPADGLVLHRPDNLGYDEAAALSFGGTTALDFLRKANAKAGDRVLINGASGSVGTAAVQLARHSGAEVTAVCSAANLDLVRSLGAHHAIDYRQEDFTRNGKTYDVIVDTVGTLDLSRVRDSLANQGRLLMLVAGLADMLKAPLVSIGTGKKVIAGPASVRREDLRQLATLAQQGKFRPVIDRRYPFEQFVEAHRYVDTGRKKGNVCLILEQ